MSEVNGPKISVNQINYSGIQKQQAEVPVEQVEDNTPQLKDFSNSKAEALGRSMLFKGADDVNNDLKAILENPEIAEARSLPALVVITINAFSKFTTRPAASVSFPSSKT